MLKALGACFFGLLAVCGVGYLIIKQQEDQTLRNQVNTAVSNFGKSIKAGAIHVKDFFAGDPVPSSTENAA